MSELSRMAQPLLDHPIVAAPPVDQLRRRGQRRRQRRLVGGTAAVLLVVGAVMVATIVPTSPKPIGNSGSSHLAAFIQKGVAVSDSTLEAIGLPPNVQAPNSVPGGAPLSQDGKPVVVFVGAEFCPYCAIERWALVVALSRFGTFSELGQTISSSSTDVFPGLQSWSFKDSTFTSGSLAFAPAEIYSSIPNSSGNGYEPLQSLTPIEKEASAGYPSEWPFVDIGGKYVALGASANPAVLQNLSLDQIASELDDPTSAAAQSVDGTANYLIAAMCSVTSSATAPICASPVVAQAQARMAGDPYDAAGSNSLG